MMKRWNCNNNSRSCNHGLVQLHIGENHYHRIIQTNLHLLHVYYIGDDFKFTDNLFVIEYYFASERCWILVRSYHLFPRRATMCLCLRQRADLTPVSNIFTINSRYIFLNKKRLKTTPALEKLHLWALLAWPPGCPQWRTEDMSGHQWGLWESRRWDPLDTIRPPPTIKRKKCPFNSTYWKYKRIGIIYTTLIHINKCWYLLGL